MKLFSSDIADITGGRLYGPADLPALEVITDSRQFINAGGMVFFSIKGINHDGHIYVDSLYSKGIRIFVVEKLPENHSVYSDASLILVKNSV